MSITKLTGIKFKWLSSVKEILAIQESISIEATKVYDTIANETNITFSNIAQKLADFELKLCTDCKLLELYTSVHPDKSFRDASTDADKALSDLIIELNMRKDVFDQFVKLKEGRDEDLSGECLRYVTKKIKDGRHLGLHCDENVRREVQSICKELSKLRIEFERNLREENCILEFSEEELRGTPPSFISALETSEFDCTKKKVSLSYPHYFPVMQHAINENTRRTIELAFNTRCKDLNGPLLRNMLDLRMKKAKLLGFETHADYVLSMRMAKDAKTVWSFLEELRKKLEPVRDKELKKLLQYKERLCLENGMEFNGRVYAWDIRFLMNKCEQEEYSVDHEKIREYFPLQKVLEGMFSIYERLLGLKFQEVKDLDSWHPEVTMYSVKDSTNLNLLGYFFMDLHPREGKYGHARIQPIQIGGVNMSGKGESERQVAVVALLTNFTKASEDRPALLKHDEVITLFHEFGHVMHVLCSETYFGGLGACTVEWDFLECPSQMLENWCWEAESLKMMSSHFKTGEPLGGESLDNLLRSRMANVGVINTRQICLATFDQRIHSSWNSESDPADIYADVTERYMTIPVSPGSHMPASFGHIAGQYDAQYYGYLWSEVFAADMFMTRFKKEGILNVTTGKDYRDLVLKPGSTKDAWDLIKDFLGRDPTQEAFLHLMGLK